MKRKLSIDERINLYILAWEEHAPENKFAGMTLQEFKTGVFSSLDIRETMKAMRNALTGKIADRAKADVISRDLANRVVHSVIADATQGADGALYRAMNYIPVNEQRSGLTHKTTASSPATTPTT